MVPDFTSEGVLPAGDYLLSMDELLQSMLVRGKAGVTSKNWDEGWRARLVGNLRSLAGQLCSVGLDQIFVDGSFVENKDCPGDIDGYFECPFDRYLSGDLERELNLLDPHSAWTWARANRQEYGGKLRLPMWMIYRVELYPHLTGLPVPHLSGIRDRSGHELEFPAAFRQSRHTPTEKCIVKLRF